MTVFIRLLETSVGDKAEALRNALIGGGGETYCVSPEFFERIPGSPFAYWVPKVIRDIFAFVPSMTSTGAQTKCGAGTLDDFRFLRLWWEINAATKWKVFPKGGTFSPWYAEISLVLSWDKCGAELKQFVETKVGSASRKIQAQDFYFRPGLTWPRRTNGLSFRTIPKECIFADKGPAAFVLNDAPEELLALCAIMNSRPFGYLVGVQLARTELAQSFEVGIIQQTPIPTLSICDRATLAAMGRNAWSLKRTLDTANETSHAFVLPKALLRRKSTFDSVYLVEELDSIQAKIDDLAFLLYGIAWDGRAEIESWGRRSPLHFSKAEEDSCENGEAASDDDEIGASSNDAEGLLSWAVGVAFGRFDIRLATGERKVPEEPEPFDPLPARSPGMREPRDPVFFRAGITSNIPIPIMADENVDGDIADVVCRLLNELCKHVDLPEFSGLTRKEIRPWIATEFFPFHIKMYSKSRRKAPIYWQLATPSASYSIWLYIHEFTNDTVFRVQEIVGVKVKGEQQALDLIRSDAGRQPTGAQKKEIEAQEAFVGEIQAMYDEIRRVVALWKPNLDDGVIINAAPLWRLFPHYKPWQKECRATWDALCQGDYDWSHLAMHVWPDRVVPKCASDRSLAIAHGLEEVFWFEDEDGKWKPLDEPARSMDDIISERTSPAVKAALKSLTEAPDTTVSAKRGRKTKTA
jgi:hypothetical protein